MRRACLCFALFLASVSARAQSDEGIFIGVTYGQLDYEVYDEEDDEELFSDNGNNFRLFGGYRLNEHFGLEVGLAKTSGIDDQFSSTLPGQGTIIESLDAEIRTLSLRAIGIVPFEHLSLYGAAGYYDASVSGYYSYGDSFSSQVFRLDDYNDSGLTVAAGMQFDFDSGLSLRGEVEWFDTASDVTAYAFNFGVVFHLNRN